MRAPMELRWVILGASLLLAVVTLRCEQDPSGPDADAAPDAQTLDAGADGAAPDATPDGSLPDGSLADADLPDASLLDADLPDASLLDADLPDASLLDADLPDAAPGDGGSPDGGSPDGGGPTCPPDMMLIGGNFCIDLWEASRPDATAMYPGVDSSYAVSAPDRLPWWSTTLTAAVAAPACAAAGKRLCTGNEWQTACAGSQQNVYGYGDVYEPATCNGIDTHCDCAQATCAAQPVCPYAFCWSQCGGSFFAMPTGAMASCVNDYGLYDMNGNVWEVVDTTDVYPFRGGAFNCGNSEANHRCDFVPTWNISAKGFRCCRDPL